MPYSIYDSRPGYISLLMMLCLSIVTMLALAHTRYIRSFTRTGYCLPVSMAFQNELRDAPVLLADQLQPGTHTYSLGSHQLKAGFSRVSSTTGVASHLSITLNETAFHAHLDELKIVLADQEIIIRGMGTGPKKERQ